MCGGVCGAEHDHGHGLGGDRDLGLQGPQEVRDQISGEVEHFIHSDTLTPTPRKITEIKIKNAL